MHVGEKDLMANSLERLEMLVSKRIRSYVMLIFDTIEEQNLLTKLEGKLGLKREVKDSISLLLNDGIRVTEYLKAMVLFEFGEESARIMEDKDLLTYVNSENQLLVEEGLRCLVQFRPELINQVDMNRAGEHKTELINHFKA